MLKLYLQNIIDDIPFESLPAKWQGFDFARFSKEKTLFDFQKQGLQNALKGLWIYLKDKNADKQNLLLFLMAVLFIDLNTKKVIMKLIQR